MAERVIDGVDAVIVSDEVIGAVAASHRMRSDDVQLFFQRGDEDLEAVEKQRIRSTHDAGALGVDERTDDDGALSVDDGRFIDALDRLARLVRGVYERQRHFGETDTFELREQAVSQHLRGEAGTVGHEEGGAFLNGH
jgi:hypothetical protein